MQIKVELKLVTHPTNRGQKLEKTFALKASSVALCCFTFIGTAGFRAYPHPCSPQCFNYWIVPRLLSSHETACPSSQLLRPLNPSTLRPSSHPATTKMKKFLYVVVLCILSLAFYLSLNSPALSTSEQLLGRRLLGEHRVPASEPAGEHKLKNLETKGGFGREEHDDGDGEGLILNADYHGVTTHPSPLPKHPRP